MAALGEFREMSTDLLRTLKRTGFSDADIAAVYGIDEDAGAAAPARGGAGAGLQAHRHLRRRVRVVHAVHVRHLRAGRARRSRRRRRRSIILGSGPNRIGQGIEFDYCCCHAVFGFREEGFETVMVNCNPETVSTDYDTADRLYFEPLTFEDVMAIIERERSAGGEVSCVVQFGGQTPLKLALRAAGGGRARSSARRRIRSTWPKTASASRSCCGISAMPQPASGTAVSREEAREVAERDRLSRWSSVRRTCSAAAAWRSCSTPARSIAT